MKRVTVLTLFLLANLLSLRAQEFGKITNPEYRYVSAPGYVNITEISGAIGISDSIVTNTKYYFGITNIFGYQINRNFSGGVGIGVFRYETHQLIPLFLEYKFNFYLKGVTPYLYVDAGGIFDYLDFRNESKIFLNPGFGISRSIGQRLEINLSAGFMLQTRTSIRRVGFTNFKLGIIFRKNPYRLFRRVDKIVYQ